MSETGQELRHTFKRLPEIYKAPDLLCTQVNAYDRFLQMNVAPGKRKKVGLEAVFQSAFPMEAASKRARLEYLSYRFDPPRVSSVAECRKRGRMYAAPLHVRLRLVAKALEGEEAPEPKEQDVYLCDVPIMTLNGTFVINGTERVMVAQLHRSPGLSLERTYGSGSQGRVIYMARIIPNRGAWLDTEVYTDDLCYVRIDRKYKFKATTLLRARGLSPANILEQLAGLDAITIKRTKTSGVQFFLQLNRDRLIGRMLPVAVSDDKGKELVPEGRSITRLMANRIAKAGITQVEVPSSWLVGRRLATDVLVKGSRGMSVGQAVQEVNEEMVEKLLSTAAQSIQSISLVNMDDSEYGAYIVNTLVEDLRNAHPEVKDADSALAHIYHVMRGESGEPLRPGEPFDKKAAQDQLKNLLFNEDRYHLSDVGRMKLNRRLGRSKKKEGPQTLENEDLVDVLALLIKARHTQSSPDEIDNLDNRRVRLVDEIVANAMRLGLIRVDRAVTERLSQIQNDPKLAPKDIIAGGPITAALNELFTTSQLSQFMDQANPLAEISHKRRMSALGEGGIARERAGFEMRDVHPTHYGRICPIESPEGPNIGLINNLAIFARVNNFGFLETPLRKVVDGRVTDDIQYYSAMEDQEFVVAHSSAPLDESGQFSEALIPVRNNNEFSLKPKQDVEFVDVSPQQVVSVAASLIPFLEHNDGNRSLMGSNMQRQAVPTLRPERPLVGTGMEALVAANSGANVIAERGGVVHQADATQVVVRANVTDKSQHPIDVYPLEKFRRSNQGTCINQRLSVSAGDEVTEGQILANGTSVDNGELALGRNIRIGFMPWNGYNFEDSIVVSRRLVEDERFTSIHIQELVCIARETKLGDEDITADIPNISERSLRTLDENGIVYVGAEVRAGDYLVGMVTPRGEQQLTPEERLLKAIYGDKADDVKDSSLKVPSDVKGTVVRVEVYTLAGIEKDSRTRAIDKQRIEAAEKAIASETAVVVDAIGRRLDEELAGQEATYVVPRGTKERQIDAHHFATHDWNTWIKVKFTEASAAHAVKVATKDITDYVNRLQDEQTKLVESIERGDTNLQPGVLKEVHVFIASKRNLQPGDKMAGRHGNKGVVSVIVPEEDMPYDETGVPLDIVLNPLGVPSRMNIGQLFETHLGWAAHGLGNAIGKMLDAKESATRIQKFLGEIYGKDSPVLNADAESVVRVAKRLRNGVPFASPVFDGAREEDIGRLMRLAGLPEVNQITLFDGRTGEAFDRPVTVGFMYMLKLGHLVEDKIHARSTGSYSLVTQQPLGGKAFFGGQRLGEMEVWALEAYGAAYTLQEILTVKSDDLMGRNRMFENLYHGDERMEAGVPEALNVLIREVRALGIDLELTKE